MGHEEWSATHFDLRLFFHIVIDKPSSAAYRIITEHAHSSHLTDQQNLFQRKKQKPE